MADVYMTDVSLCSDIACDITNTDIVDTGSKAAWQGYVTGHARYKFPEMSYQRENYLIRVPVSYNDLLKCNYVMYKNADMGDFVFFAYIERLEYRNDELTYVYIKEDIFHTFQDNIKMLPCYIERKHAETDVRGDNLMMDNLATGEYVIDGMVGKLWDDFVIIIGTTQTLWDAGEVVAGTFLNKMFSGVKLYMYDMTIPGAPSQFVLALQLFARNGHMGAIQFMYMVPREMVSGTFDSPSPVGEKIVAGVYPTALDGYVPRNQKLLTYPYVAVAGSNLAGNTIEYRYEYFSSSAPTWGFRGSITMDGRIMVYPKSYKKQLNCLDESFLCPSYPRLSWNQGGFAEWSAVQSIKYKAEDTTNFLGKLGSAVSIGAGLASKNPTGAVASAVNLVAGDLIRDVNRDMAGQIAELNPPSVRGLVGADSTLVENGLFGFVLYAKSITAEVAASIDDYYDMFGYPFRRIGTPKNRYRPAYNYIKTIGCKVEGISPERAAEVESWYDRGVRFWNIPEQFCDFSVNNKI